MMNRLANCHNRYQGNYKKVLCVCSAGLLRSPTAAFVLAQDYGYNTRAAGLSQDYALIPVDRVLLEWADEIVCMNEEQRQTILIELGPEGDKPVINLDIPDDFRYRDPQLVLLIQDAYKKHLVQVQADPYVSFAEEMRKSLIEQPSERTTTMAAVLGAPYGKGLK